MRKTKVITGYREYLGEVKDRVHKAVDELFGFEDKYTEEGSEYLNNEVVIIMELIQDEHIKEEVKEEVG